MRTIFNLFGEAPFESLQTHMNQVHECVYRLSPLFDSLGTEDLENLVHEIKELEHLADTTKHHLRKHLPRSLFLPVDRTALLEILSFQDKIADYCEKIADAVTFYPLEMPEAFEKEFSEYLKSITDIYQKAQAVITEFHDLTQSSFGGVGAENIEFMVEEITLKQYRLKKLEHNLFKKLYSLTGEMPYVEFHIWQKVFAYLGKVSHLAEKLVYRVRRMLESR